MEKRGYNYICAPLYMSKNEEHKESLEQMMQTISQMFSYFGIENKVVCTKNNRSEDIDRFQIGVQMSNAQENLIKYYDTIGYRYDTRKICKSAIVVEYLKYKRHIFIEIVIHVIKRELIFKN